MLMGVISAYADEDWHTQQIVGAARAQGQVVVLSPTDMAAEMDGPGSDWQGLMINGVEASQFDVILTPRALGDAGNHDLQLELYHTLCESGILLVNRVEALLVALDKFKSTWLFARAGLPTPKTVVVQQLEPALAAVARLGRVVVKPLYGSLGQGIELLDGRDRNRLEELLAQRGALYLQSLVEEVSADVRAFVVGCRVEAAVRRRLDAGEFRSNHNLGAEADEIELEPEIAQLAVKAVRAVGLDYGGVDLLITPSGPLLIEVNGTPSFNGILETTGHDMAEPIVEHAARCAQRWRAERKSAPTRATEERQRHPLKPRVGPSRVCPRQLAAATKQAHIHRTERQNVDQRPEG